MLREDAGRSSPPTRRAGRRYDLVLVDPPYAMLARFLPRLASHLPAVLAENGLVVVESDSREEPDLPLPHADEPPLRLVPGHRLRGATMSESQPGHRASARAATTRSRTATWTSSGARPEIFERVVVGVVRDPQHKATLFSVDERVAFLREALADVPNVEVEVFSDLVVEFARRFGARTMVKGLRAISDFEWEFQMHHLNRNLAPEVETMYLMSSPQYSFLSSSGVKEVASFGGSVDDLVPEAVAKRFRELFPQGRPGAPVSPQE